MFYLQGAAVWFVFVRHAGNSGSGALLSPLVSQGSARWSVCAWTSPNACALRVQPIQIMIVRNLLLSCENPENSWMWSFPGFPRLLGRMKFGFLSVRAWRQEKQAPCLRR